MRSPTSISVWIGGWMSVVSGLFLAVAHTIDLTMAGGNDSLAGKSIVFAAHLLLVFALFGLHEAQGNRNGSLGTAGMLCGVIGTIIVTAIILVEIAGVSGVSTEEVFEAGIVRSIYQFGPLLFVLGMLLFSSSVIRNKILSYWGGMLLLAGTIVFSLGTLAGPAEAVVSTIGALLTGTGLMRLGYSLLKTKRESENVAPLKRTTM